MLVGVSRKSFLGRFGAGDGEPRAAGDRLEASLALATWAMARGATMVRAHDVAPTLEAARLVGGEWGAAA